MFLFFIFRRSLSKKYSKINRRDLPLNRQKIKLAMFANAHGGTRVLSSALSSSSSVCSLRSFVLSRICACYRTNMAGRFLQVEFFLNQKSTLKSLLKSNPEKTIGNFINRNQPASVRDDANVSLTSINLDNMEIAKLL